MLPEFPKARIAMIEIWNRTFFAALHQSDPVLAEIPVRVQKEGNQTSLGDSDMNYEQVSAQWSYDWRDGEGLTPEEFVGGAVKLGQEMAEKQAKRLFEKLLAEPGPHVQPIRIDGTVHFRQILGFWRRMEISFGSDGMPVWPPIVADPNFRDELLKKFPEWLKDPEFQKEMTALIESKRKEFDEREACRRLAD